MSEINVNLKPCTCGPRTIKIPEGRYLTHFGDCPATAVLIPLSLEPFRSVTFTVRLGECSESCRQYMPTGQHTENCPARPIRVSCSISGKTWEESEVLYVENADRSDRMFVNVDPERILAACRERWADARAVVLGKTVTPSFGPEHPIMKQRDAVYAALADMARAEEAARNAQARAVAAFPWSKMKRDWDGDHIGNRRPSEDMLERYVEHLIEQVGKL